MHAHLDSPDYIVHRLQWLLEDGIVDDDRPLSADRLRNVLAGRDLDAERVAS